MIADKVIRLLPAVLLVFAAHSNNGQKRKLSGRTILVVINCSRSHIVSSNYEVGRFMA